MDPVWIPILGITFGTMIPIVALVAKLIVQPMLEHRRLQMELEAKLLAEKTAQYAAGTERLEQRVRVLERIVTDRGMAVADEIERLRDAPLN
ncbi:hypothetical protein ACNI3Q_10470 [Sphingomonas sp. FW199]|uniref:hypothetical protein n=1 Tax=unclassified Sphingomonas TaxID=196159 RepID=UPI0021A3A2E9|nr:hypothetical protein [Sphingomonas sp. BGYR3]MDG5489773.1 hypothetical protein [Sphingomonas sp. BGYR3]